MSWRHLGGNAMPPEIYDVSGRNGEPPITEFAGQRLELKLDSHLAWFTGSKSPADVAVFRHLIAS